MGIYFPTVASLDGRSSLLAAEYVETSYTTLIVCHCKISSCLSFASGPGDGLTHIFPHFNRGHGQRYQLRMLVLNLASKLRSNKIANTSPGISLKGHTWFSFLFLLPWNTAHPQQLHTPPPLLESIFILSLGFALIDYLLSVYLSLRDKSAPRRCLGRGDSSRIVKYISSFSNPKAPG